MRENILYSSEWDDSIRPFTEQECREFGEGDLKGTFIIKKFEESLDHMTPYSLEDYHDSEATVVKNEKTHFIYEKKEKKLLIYFLDENNSIYIIGGWFGERFFEFLQSNGHVEQFLEQHLFKGNNRPREIFKRLLMTLSRKNILSLPKSISFASTPPFLEKEYSSFGVGDFTGNITFISNEDLLAYAHAFQYECNDGGVGGGTEYGDLPGRIPHLHNMAVQNCADSGGIKRTWVWNNH